VVVTELASLHLLQPMINFIQKLRNSNLESTLLLLLQLDLAKEAVKALEAVHGTVFEPINAADLCK
jgi:hypothetical protein